MDPINKFLLVTTDLIEAVKTRADSFLPYPLLRYQNFQPRPRYHQYHHASGVGHVPVAQIIEAENIYRPAVLIPCPDRSANVGKVFRNMPPPPRRGDPLCRQQERISERKLATEYIRFWGIPYRVIDRAGYDTTFPSMEGNALFIEDNELNAIYHEGDNEDLIDDDDNEDLFDIEENNEA